MAEALLVFFYILWALPILMYKPTNPEDIKEKNKALLMYTAIFIFWLFILANTRY